MEPTSGQQAHHPPPSLPYHPAARAGQARAYRPLLRPDRQASQREVRIGTAQAWISIALGLAGLLAPRSTSRVSGLPYWPTLLRLVGARELASGIGLMAQPKSAVWRWARLAGDAMDGAVIGTAFFAPAAQRRRLAATVAVVGAIVALDVRSGAIRRSKLSSQTLPKSGGRHAIAESLLINCSPGDCYQSWRNFENFPRFMLHLESVRALDERHSHWCATAPGGTRVEWDAEVTEDRPGELIAWRSQPGSQIVNSGQVQFRRGPGGQGTLLVVDMEYKPPAGSAGAVLARLFGEEPSQQMHGDLRRFKQLMETGEVPTTRGQPHGERTLKSTLFNKELEQ